MNMIIIVQVAEIHQYFITEKIEACYCTLDAQCGYGWTCDLTQGDGDNTKGKCVKNP